MIIATVLSGNVDYLVTGDKDRFVLKEVNKSVIYHQEIFGYPARSRNILRFIEVMNIQNGN